MERYDIAIIGTGPAGLSAAVTARIRNKNIILFGSPDLSSKMGSAHEIQNYLGLPAISGDDLRKAFISHIESMGIQITGERISAVYNMGNYFGLQSAGRMYEASAVIIATGVVMDKPYPGEEEFLGKGVSYCATCDAPLYRKKTVAVIGTSAREEAEADFMSEVASKVYYFPQYEGNVNVLPAVEVVYGTPSAIIGTDKAHQLKTDRGTYDVDGIFVLRESVPPSQLMPGLKMEDGHVSVNRLMATDIPGCFACGDITGRPYQYIKSAGEGNVAALSAVSYIDQNRYKEMHPHA